MQESIQVTLPSYATLNGTDDGEGKRGVDFAIAVPRFKKGEHAEWGKKIVDAVGITAAVSKCLW